MLFDYRYWLRRFLDWLLNDEDDSEKMVTKGLIGEAPFLLVYLHTCVITAEIKYSGLQSGEWRSVPILTFLFLIRYQLLLLHC